MYYLRGDAQMIERHKSVNSSFKQSELHIYHEYALCTY